MIDIIIPAYNAHDTIEDTLHSIAMQVNKKDLQVIIVNDGGKGYEDIIKNFNKWLNMKELTCPSNIGPGYARNYGIENSNSEYIMFMDADDTLSSSYSISLLSTIAQENRDTNIIISKVLQIDRMKEKDNFVMTELEPNMTWLFGHLYKREFLNKYNIRFLTSCYNEDVGFNSLCQLFSLYENLERGIAVYGGPATYEWRWREGSLSQKGSENLYDIQLRILGHWYNSIKVLQQVDKYSIPIEQCVELILTVLFTIYQYSYLLYNLEYATELTKDLEILAIYFYHKYYKSVLEIISIENIFIALQNFIDREISLEEQKRLQMSFEDFTNLILSKFSKEEINDNNIQLKLLPLKE